MEAGKRDYRIYPNAVIICIADNIEHKVKFGQVAGTFKSNTSVAFRVIPEWKLIKDGILNHIDKSTRLCREQKNWEEDIVM